jgi:hypothetical protein
MPELHDLLVAPGLAGLGPTEHATRSLDSRIADVVERLARVVEGLDSGDPAAASTVAYLRDWSGGTALQDPVPFTLSAPLDRLVNGFGLSSTELDLVVLAGLPEEHEGLTGTLRSLNPLGEPRPTVGLAGLVLAEAGVSRAELRRVLREGSAVSSGLLRLEGGTGLPESALVLADCIWDVLRGVDAVPPALDLLDLGDRLPGLDDWLDEPPVRHAARVVRERAAVTVLLAGEDDVVMMSRCAALLDRIAGRPFPFRPTLDHGALPRAEILLGVAHAVARDAVPVFVVDHLEPGGAPLDLAPLTDVPGPVVVIAPAGRVRPRGSRPVLVLPVGPVSPAAGRLAWTALLPGVDDVAAAAISERAPVDPAWIAGVARDVVASGLPPTPRTVAAALRRRTSTLLPSGVTLESPDIGWDHLVLPAEAAHQLGEAVSRLEHQRTVLEEWCLAANAHASRGVRILLTGPPGTGKTLAAEVLATAAETDLLRVDLSQVVSKWLGETEKNLAATFAAAERTHAVLLFDEADALFGSRTEISDANDRYANLETAYLLQRLDAFAGLTVLTTNLRHNIDAAFLRRMDFVVEFPTPDEQGRQHLWSLHLPADHLSADVNVDTLARMYQIPGGWIRNAAVAASFVAAAAGSDVHQHHLTAAVRREYGKASLPFPGEPPRRTP